MPILFAIALAATAATAHPAPPAASQPGCSWDRPAAFAYAGTPEALIDHYIDMPEKVRNRLKLRLAYGNPDELVEIRRDAIHGKQDYAPVLREMQYGRAQSCSTVSRTTWAASQVEPGAVYCADNYCVLVSTAHGNLSRITRLTAATALEAPPPEEAPARDWNKHVGNKELGLVDAPEQHEHEGDEGLKKLAAQEQPDPTKAAPEAVATAVPEPETWAMMLGGLGLLGFMAQRRRLGR